MGVLIWSAATCRSFGVRSKKAASVSQHSKITHERVRKRDHKSTWGPAFKSGIKMLLVVIKMILAGATLAANAFYLLSLIAGAKFFIARRPAETGNLKPVSIMIPLAGADFRAYENYARLCRQDYPAAYQIVFGVREATDSSIPIVEKLQADFAGCDIELVVCPEVIGTNLKVSNLRNILARAKHEQLVIVDSDIRVEKDYLRRVMAPL